MIHTRHIYNKQYSIIISLFRQFFFIIFYSHVIFDHQKDSKTCPLRLDAFTTKYTSCALLYGLSLIKCYHCWSIHLEIWLNFCHFKAAMGHFHFSMKTRRLTEENVCNESITNISYDVFAFSAQLCSVLMLWGGMVKNVKKNIRNFEFITNSCNHETRGSLVIVFWKKKY